MSLFVINRYLGEDNEQPIVSEENHLDALKKRIKEQKREKEVVTSEIPPNESEESERTSKKKKKKKKNKTDSELNGSLTYEETNEVSKKKKTSQEDSLMEIDKEDISQEINHLHLNELAENNLKMELNDSANEEKNDRTEIHLAKSTIKKKKKKEKNKNVSNGELTDSNVKNDKSDVNLDFTILNAGKQTKGETVRRVLPDWLSNPEVVSSNLNSGPSLDEIAGNGQLDLKIIENLRSQGFTKLFPVQVRLLSWLLQCNENRKKGFWSRDTCVSAPTGSGKTLAYVLPIVEILRTRFIRKIHCLIVLPVQELALQVFKVIEKYVNNLSFEHTRLKVGLVSGAASFEKEQEALISKDSKGNFTSRIDILVATPRRLIDHIHKTSGFSLNDLQFLVIDEADRETFDWLQQLPAPHFKAPTLTLNNMLNNPIPAQKLLFSATLSQDPEKLSRLGLFHPILYTTAVVKSRDDDVNLDKEFVNNEKEEGDVGRFTSPNELTIKAIQCEEEYKPIAVYHLLKKIDHTLEKSLIFTNSCNAAHRLTLLLKSILSEKNLSIAELSGQMTSKNREQAYQKFLRGETRILICSDVLARGVDIPGIKLVISYDPPKHMRAFIHRAGRTGRAGIPGTAVFLLIPRQISMFKKLFTTAKRTIPKIKEKDFTSLAEKVNYNSHIENFKDSLEKERNKNGEKRRSMKKLHEKQK